MTNGRKKNKEGFYKNSCCSSKHKDKEDIVTMSVTKEDVYDERKMLKELVDGVSNRHSIKKVLADDGGYDSKDNFGYLDKQNILPVIKVRKNSSVHRLRTTLDVFHENYQ